MIHNDVLMGTLPESWKSSQRIKYITFNVTEDCNLMCEYCYFTHKNTKTKMSFEIAQKAVDFILHDESLLIYDGVVWDFIGGEPTLEMRLIDQICDYILVQMFNLKHKWFYCYRFMIGTNGVLYSSKDMQNFVNKHKKNVCVNITVDGSKYKHDLSRKKKDGSGSYDDVVRVLPLWFEQTGNVSTKATFAHEDLPYLKESIINLWNLGFKYVMANVVFENVWQPGDEKIYEQELFALADYVIENKLWNDYSVRFFSPGLGFSLEASDMSVNYCGSGNMLAIDTNGDFYPCIRFLDSALNNRKGRKIGSISQGFDTDKIRAFNALSVEAQSSDECLKCNISAGCSWCTGYNFDDADHDTIFQRKTHICSMHKANVKASKYFWRRYEETTGLMSPMRYNQYKSQGVNQKYMYIMANDAVDFCYRKKDQTKTPILMPDSIMADAVAFCDDNYITPVFVGAKEKKYYGFYFNEVNDFVHKDEFCVDIIKSNQIENVDPASLTESVILCLKSGELKELVSYLMVLGKCKKINLLISDYDEMTFENLRDYKRILDDVIMWLYSEWKKENYVQLDFITDALFNDQHSFCMAGENEVTLGPDGNIYPCPAFYGEKHAIIGNLHDGLLTPPSSFNITPIMCKHCDAVHCKKCKYLNKLKTDEYCVSSELNCVKMNVELDYSRKFRDLLMSENIELPFEILDFHKSSEHTFDPLVRLRGKTFVTGNII